MRTSESEALAFSLLMSAVGFYLALTTKLEGDPNESLYVLRRFVRNGAWIVAVGALLAAIRVLLGMLGYLSK